MLTLLIATTLVAPPLTRVADADAMAWVHVPDLGKGVKALRGSAFADLGLLLLPTAQIKTLETQANSELLAAVYRSSQPGAGDVILWMDVGKAQASVASMMETWLGQMGLTKRNVSEKDE